MNEYMWNPWHGCHRYSEGCQNCYMFSFDEKMNVDSNIIFKTNDFNMPLKKNRQGAYKIEHGSVVRTCLTSDFFIEEADCWRAEVWRIIKWRKDLRFCLFTKRAERIEQCLPNDWGDGYPNVAIFLTCENQRRVDERLPIFLNIPCQFRCVLVAPILEEINLEKYLATGEINLVSCSGENYDNARPCHYEWVKKIYEQCRLYDIDFDFFATGSNFYKEGKKYFIPYNKGKEQAYKSGLKYTSSDTKKNLLNI